MTTVLGQYSLVHELPMQGVCRRWIAHDGGREPTLVIVTGFPAKLTQHEGTRRRLEYRVCAAERLRLPPILGTLGYGLESGCFFVVEEFAYGESLGAIARAAGVAGAPLPLTWLQDWVKECALALHAAHAVLFNRGRGPSLGHGGLDPERVFIDYEGRVKVAGYGIGDVVHYANLHSRGRAFPDSAPYQAPEQSELGWPPTTSETTDCYQLGLLMTEMLDGRVPPPAFRKIIDRAVAPRALERHDNLRALAAALQEWEVTQSGQPQYESVDAVLGMRMSEWAELAAAMRRGDYVLALDVVRELATTPATQVMADELADTLVRGQPVSAPEGSADVSLTDEFSPPFDGDVNDTPTNKRVVDEELVEVDRPQTFEPVSSTVLREDPPEEQPGFGHGESEPYEVERPFAQEHVEPAPAAAPEQPPIDPVDPEVLGEEYEPFEEPFDADLLTTPPERELSSSESGTDPVVEIIRIVNGRVVGTVVLDKPSRRYFDAGHNVRVRLGKEDVEVDVDASFVAGTVGGVRREEGTLPPSGRVRLRPGEYANLDDQGVIHRVRVFYPPSPPAKNEPLIKQQDARLYAITIATSVVFHAFALVGVVLTASLGVDLTVQKHDPVEVFAEGRLKKEEPEPKKKDPPKEKPKPKPKPKRKLAEKKPADPTEQKALIPKSVRKKLDRRMRKKKTSDDASENLLKALKSPVAGEGETVTDVVSNIDAPNKGSNSAAFKVAGTLKALEGKNVNIATGGGGKLGDIGGQVAKDTGKLKRRKSSGKVRGKVSTVKALAKVQGSLARADVYREINRHLGRIQACYENQLLKNPGIAGKITFEWTVKTNGSVRSVRQISSTVGEKAVSKCVQGVIRKMKFPRPKGGEVVIRYPFIFRSAN